MQELNHFLGAAGDHVVGEPDHLETPESQVVVARSVPLGRHAPRVEPESVKFDHEAPGRPEAVDPVAEQRRIDLGVRDPAR